MLYLNCKKTGRTQDAPRKGSHLKAIDNQSWEKMLQAVEDSSDVNEHWQRDYAIIFLGAALGLRRGEVAILERKHFRDMETEDIIHAPTLKASEKIQFKCKNPDCLKRSSVKASRSGKEFKCWKCGVIGMVDECSAKKRTGVIEKDLDIVEEATISFVVDYLNSLPKNQHYLFQGRGENPISLGHINRIFNTFAHFAGLNPRLSFHSLRHNRGVKVWSMFKDLVAVKNALRHSDIKASQIYADLDSEQRSEYKKALEKKAFDPMKKRRAI